jgi:hypothetical protein
MNNLIAVIRDEPFFFSLHPPNERENLFCFLLSFLNVNPVNQNLYEGGQVPVITPTSDGPETKQKTGAWDDVSPADAL